MAQVSFATPSSSNDKSNNASLIIQAATAITMARVEKTVMSDEEASAFLKSMIDTLSERFPVPSAGGGSGDFSQQNI